ncbi:MAG: rod shape-determining protein MreD, partial [Pseudomonadota bacterium]
QRQLSLWIIILSGLALDVLYGTLMGQHALALLIMSYLPMRLYLRLRVFSWLKLTGAVAGMLFIYEFMLFWINGLSGITTHTADYWVPVLTGTLVWPLVLVLLDGIAVRRSNAH